MILQMKRNARLLLKGNLARGAVATLILFSVALLFKTLEVITQTVLELSGVSASVKSALNLPGLLGNLPIASPVSISVTAGFLILAFAVMAPLVMGVKAWFFGLSGGDNAELSAIFHYYSGAKLYFKSLLLLLDICLRSFFWLYVLILPGALLSATGGALLTAKLNVPNGRLLGTLSVAVGVLLAVLGLVFALVIITRYFLAPYLFAQNAQLRVRQAVKTSVRYMHGSAGRLVLLLLSFMLWALASLLVLPALYAFPYAESTLAIFARFTIERGRMADNDAGQPAPQPWEQEIPAPYPQTGEEEY
ncbi:DUF975 family protein [Acetanaerobacterium elongatum]|uniref:Membrane domain of glycerophosphoryl diester phosphodiesterase n=1 Tax=Acetanaerobacterium elongatum TaxID=258515 RepID=A0A1G9V131_9FIRM|nr:DUF975 family protein [Acetanaerobacterium elongatum]SDM65813.1 Protein of unknown function [Acetanaerobacterium elongatum]